MKPVLESIVHKGMSIREFKEQIIKEAYKQGVDQPLTVDRYAHSPDNRGCSDNCHAPCRFRLRKKTWKSPGTVYLDHQIIERDIHVFANFEMYVEPLEGQPHTPTTLTPPPPSHHHYPHISTTLTSITSMRMLHRLYRCTYYRAWGVPFVKTPRQR